MENSIQCTVGFKKAVVATHANKAHKYGDVGTGPHPQLMQSGSISLKTSPPAKEK